MTVTGEACIAKIYEGRSGSVRKWIRIFGDGQHVGFVFLVTANTWAIGHRVSYFVLGLAEAAPRPASPEA